MNCAECETKDCYHGKDCTGLREQILPMYADEKTRLVHTTAAEIERNFYMKVPRVAEVVEYIKALGIRRIGIAFCIGLSEEAQIATKIFSQHCEVHSVCCKVCAIPKSALGEQGLSGNPDKESICNPLGQAELLNRAATELNLTVGLCVGHDVLFIRHSAADVSPLIVKDRVLSHNPAGALYSRYHRKRLIEL
jgi:uncharacterized metal-binding protein